MEYEALKLELIEWLVKLKDEKMLDHLKKVKDANVMQEDGWLSLTDEQNLK